MMLNALRKSSGTWVVKIFLGLLVLSFAAWGIGDIFRMKPDASVAEVGNSNISGIELLTDFNRQVRRLQASLGPTFDSAKARNLGLVDQVLQKSITRALYDQEIAELELTISDENIADWIRQSPAFRNTFGRFDKLLFERRLLDNGFNEQTYIAAARRDLSREQLFATLLAGSRAPQPLVKAFYRYEKETRVLELLNVQYDKVTKFKRPSEVDLRGYYEAHKNEYMTPEYRSLTYLTIGPEDLVAEILASEEEIKNAYEARLAEFTTPPSRKIEQIVVTEKSLAQKITGRLKDGNDFYIVANELANMDKKSVQLGEVQKNDIPEEAVDRVFSMASGTISEPIETGLGWHIFRVLKIMNGGVKTINAVHDALERDIKLEKAAESIFELANKIEDQLAGGSSINEIAEYFNLKQGLVSDVDIKGNDRNGQPIKSLPKAPEFLQNAFTINPGDEGQLLDSSDGSYFLVQVDQIIKAAPERFKDIHNELETAVILKQRAKTGAAIAKKMAAEARNGKSLTSLGLASQTTPIILKSQSRQQAAADQRLNKELVQKVFHLGIGEIAEGVSKSGDSHSIVRVISKDSPGDIATTENLKQMNNSVRSSMADDLLAQFRIALRQKYNVTIHDGVIDSLFDELNVRQ